MRTIVRLLIVLLFGHILTGCFAVSHTYGPYMGKVVEKGTGTPIEGAVVFLEFSTRVGNIGGYSTHYIDAVETLTDSKGEFTILPHKINTFKFMHYWKERPGVIIFKPGYGAFPGHHATMIKPYKEEWFAPDTPLVIELPRLKNREERKKNLRNVTFTSDVPYGKWQKLFEFRNIESVEVGLKPYKNPSEESK